MSVLPLDPTTTRDTETEVEVMLIDDFRFVFHRNYEALSVFSQDPRPYRIIHSKPSLTSYSNAIYTPAARNLTSGQRLGCLYDEDLHRIESSCIIRGRSDKVWNTDPLRYEEDSAGLTVYEHPVVYLGFINTHFGHYMIETLSRWWPLNHELGEVNRFLFHVRAPEDLEKPHIREGLSAMGIDAENRVYFDRPVRLKSVLVPEVTYQAGSHIYSEYVDFMRRLALKMGIDPAITSDQPVYLSRSRLKNKTAIRETVGEEKIESFMASRGVRIVHPQELSFSEQIRVINEHRHIIGVVGSQFQTVAAALEPKTITMLIDDEPAGLFPLMKACGHSATYVKVIRQTNLLSTYTKLLRQKITGKPFHHAQGFLKTFEIDSQRTIDWFTISKIL